LDLFDKFTVIYAILCVIERIYYYKYKTRRLEVGRVDRYSNSIKKTSDFDGEEQNGDAQYSARIWSRGQKILLWFYGCGCLVSSVLVSWKMSYIKNYYYYLGKIGYEEREQPLTSMFVYGFLAIVCFAFLIGILSEPKRGKFVLEK